MTAVQELRRAELYKPPGIAETLDWAGALQVMERDSLDENLIGDTLGVLLKHQEDIQLTQGKLARDLARLAHERT